MPHSILTLSYLSSGSNSTALPGSDVDLAIGLGLGLGFFVVVVVPVLVVMVMFIVTIRAIRRRGWCICMSCTYHVTIEVVVLL